MKTRKTREMKKTKSFSKEALALFLTGTSSMQIKEEVRTVMMMNYLKREKL